MTTAQRFGLSVLDYIVASNHIHLLVKDTGANVIAQSMQLIAGRSAQEYNQRRKRQGAFWEDRYHATAIAADEHLQRCFVYIDLNMVRAGVVEHPADWQHSGYREIQEPRARYAIIDVAALSDLCGFEQPVDFQRAHREWIADALGRASAVKDGRWSQALAVGSLSFVEQIKSGLGVKALHREVVESESDGACTLQEASEPYGNQIAGENDVLRFDNEVEWDQNAEEAES